MSATIIRHDQAIADLEAIVDLIHEDTPKTAAGFVKAAENSIQLLAQMPETGHRLSFGLAAPIRYACIANPQVHQIPHLLPPHRERH